MGAGRAHARGAFHHVDDVVLSLLADAPAPRVVDLGCGVGGSLVHLAAQRADLVGEGITISPAQVTAAATLIERAGLASRVRVREGDFAAPPADLAGADLALSIEAFVHGPDPAAYLRAAAGLLRPGGLLVLCDDLLTVARGRAVRRRGGPAGRVPQRLADRIPAHGRAGDRARRGRGPRADPR